MEKLLKRIKNQLKIGQVVKGKVLKIGKNEIWLDLEGLATGIVRGQELQDELGDYSNLKIGQEVIATVIKEENERGEVELSFRSASHLKTWETLKKIQEEKKPIEVKVLEANRGGLVVQYKKVRGFIPSSHLASPHFPQVANGDKNKILEKLKQLVGKTLEVRVIDVQAVGNKVIFSEKEIESERRNLLFKKYKVGDLIEGEIVGISPFGAFLEFDEKIRGLIHISELAWQRVGKIEDIVKIGEKIKAKILSIDDGKISLSLKRLSFDPWQKIEERYKVGDKISGKIFRVTPYGMFVEVDKDIHGLVHISEIPKEFLADHQENKIGKIFEFKIISLEPEDHRLGLSLKNI